MDSDNLHAAQDPPTPLFNGPIPFFVDWDRRMADGFATGIRHQDGRVEINIVFDPLVGTDIVKLLTKIKPMGIAFGFGGVVKETIEEPHER